VGDATAHGGVVPPHTIGWEDLVMVTQQQLYIVHTAVYRTYTCLPILIFWDVQNIIISERHVLLL
jgi:hypothetical protein